MLAGCSSSTLLSPRHRLRSEASSAQFHACHFQLASSMSTQRLDLPCSFPHKDASRSQPLKRIEAKPKTCSLKHNIRLPPLTTTLQPPPFEVKDHEEFWDRGNKNLKRFASEEEGTKDEYDYAYAFSNRAKRIKGITDHAESDEDDDILGPMGAQNFWFQLDPSLPFSLTCSDEEEEEEMVCFLPSEVVSEPLPLPLSNDPWVESVVTKITELGEKDTEDSHGGIKEASISNTSSESQSLSQRLNENASEHEVDNGSGNPYPHDDSREENRGFELVSLLTACVEAIASKNMAAINHFIAKLGDLASPYDGTPISRLCAYFTESLTVRVTRLWPPFFHVTIPREIDRVEDENGTALRYLNHVSPIPKFLHFTSNEILLRAFEGKDRVHIIDFDIKQGLQWPSLFQSLASRTNPPRHVRITGIGESKHELNETGDRLAGFAEALNLSFEFHAVVDRLEDVRLWMLHVKENESVGVNCVLQLHKMLYDGNGGALSNFLRLIRSTNPSVVVMAEQEAEHNEARLETRVCNSLKYYAALFDSIDHCLPMDSPMRLKIEEMYAREIRNIIACEGSDRIERHQNFKKWRRMMEEGGFKCMGISERERNQSHLLLKMNSCENYNVKQEEEAAAITVGWLDQPLYSVSAWAPLDDDAAGSS